MTDSNNNNNNNDTSSVVSIFPGNDLIPRKETQSYDFITNNPIYDGRDVTIGIFDTGIDPGISTLRYMSDGTTPKLIHLIDCTGSCDVDVTTERMAIEMIDPITNELYWELTSLTGRIIKLSTKLTICPFPNPTTTTTVTVSESTKLDADETTTKLTRNKEEAKDDDGVDDSTSKQKTTTEDTTPETKDEKTITVRVGWKRAYELFPPSVVSRIKKERQKVLIKELDTYIAKLHNDKSSILSSGAANNKKLSVEQKNDMDDIEARLAVLQSKDWYGTDDPGPIYDCIVYYDGTNYRTIIDSTDTDGDLRSDAIKPLTSYNVEYQYSTFSTIDQVNYAVNFYNNGTVLSIVCDITPHGTHVASIAAASSISSSQHNNNSNNQSRQQPPQYDPVSGVAPGAKLISFKIGDTRLGGMETGTALTRAVIAAIRYKCDIINMSYGEDVQLPNHGRFVQFAEELVYKHNIIFMSSAGNSGPALSSVNAPGGTMSCVIGVAASVSPAMANSMYALPYNQDNNKNSDTTSSDEIETTTTAKDDNNSIIDTTYTWSSTGPAVDGDNGISITAPGAAITNVSHWSLTKNMLMNGTSMSCPNATGCVALLLSACKANNIPISPARIRRAIEITASTIPNKSTVQQGWGMIQVTKAFEYLQQHRDDPNEDIYYNVQIVNKKGNVRGIYLRNPDETSVRQTITVRVHPTFRREEIISDTIQQLKLNYEVHVELHCTESWVTAPHYLYIMNQARDFKIEINPTQLPAGGFYTAKVIGYNVNRPTKDVTNTNRYDGIVFSVPITIVKPLPTQRIVQFDNVEFAPAEVKRYFVVPPAGATFMDIEITDIRNSTNAEENDSSTKLIVLHTVQLLPHASYKQFEKHKSLMLAPGQTVVTSVAVEEANTIEVCLSRYWSTVGITKVAFKITFRGVHPTPNRLNIVAGSMGGLVRLNAIIDDEIIEPKATFKKWQTPLRPTNATITPLADTDDRDVFPAPDKVIYQLVLQYTFEQSEKGSFVPRAPALQGMLYESGYESQIMLFFDGDKKYLGMSDMKPESIDAPKGTVTVRVQVRHDDPSQLEKLKDMILWIERNLPSDITLLAYETKTSLIAGSNPLQKQILRKGTSISVFFAEPPASKLPSKCQPGDQLVGTMTFESNSSDSSRTGDNKRPGGYPVRYCIGPKATESSPPQTIPVEPEDKRTDDEKYGDAYRDFQIDYYKKLISDKKDSSLIDEKHNKLVTEYPNYVPLHLARLQYLDSHKDRLNKLSDIISAAETVVQHISEDEIALTLGKNGDEQDPKYIKDRDTAKKNKEYLIEALTRKALAVVAMDVDATSNKLFDETLKHLNVWTNEINSTLALERDIRAGRFGLALKSINQLLSNDSTESKGAIRPLSRSELLKKRATLFEKLGYKLLVDYDKYNQIVSCPPSFMPF